ncbi:MAG: precorrin-6A/cobalt-precorrin-6A reductase [Butyricicoccus sp.]
MLEKCAALGFPGAHIIAMQGPFSQAMNAALLRARPAQNPRDQGHRRVRRLCGEGRGS